MIGAERLSQLGEGTGPGGRPIGAEFAEALRLAHDELGVRAVRSHAILHDDVGVYREDDGRPVHDFAGVDRIYDQVLELGLRPVVEVGFMPHDLARDPSKKVFHYNTEEFGVVRRTVDGRATTYELTDAGESLRPIVLAIGHWGTSGSAAGSTTGGVSTSAS